MKLKVMLSGFVSLAALFTGASAFAGYDNQWYQAAFWPGEYPNGFAVVGENVSVPARPAMDHDIPASMSCGLPQKAVFHQWNEKRKADFMTAAEILPMYAKEDFTYNSQDPHPLIAKKGDLIEFLIPLSEGYFNVRFNGEEYLADEELFEHVTYNAEPYTTKQDLWLKVPCTNGGDAWILFSDLWFVDKNGNSQFIPGLDDWWGGFKEYGKVEDLP
jgi:hypothetical protein